VGAGVHGCSRTCSSARTTGGRAASRPTAAFAPRRLLPEIVSSGRPARGLFPGAVQRSELRLFAVECSWRPVGRVLLCQRRSRSALTCGNVTPAGQCTSVQSSWAQFAAVECAIWLPICSHSPLQVLLGLLGTCIELQPASGYLSGRSALRAIGGTMRGRPATAA
jgi:hypothetical protein